MSLFAAKESVNHYSPSLEWVKQQIRDACPFGIAPRFLIHDNDGIFGQVRHAGRKFRSNLDQWLTDTMGIRGLPTPYGAPNANAFVERFNRTLRREALDHFVFVSKRHLLRVCREYVEFYSRARPSQAIDAIPDPYDELRAPTSAGRVVTRPVLGGVQHDYRRAA